MDIGLRIKHENQSDEDPLKMILRGDGFLAQITRGGRDTGDTCIVYIEALVLMSGVRGGRFLARSSRFLVRSMGNREAGLKPGEYRLTFESELYHSGGVYCSKLPPEMFAERSEEG